MPLIFSDAVVIAMTYFPSEPTSENEANTGLRLRRRARPGPDDGRTSLMFWLTVLGLGCVSLGLMTWGASSALSQKGSEKLLRVSLLLPKLKSIYGERKANAFRKSEPEPSDLAHPRDRK